MPEESTDSNISANTKSNGTNNGTDGDASVKERHRSSRDDSEHRHRSKDRHRSSREDSEDRHGSRHHSKKKRKVLMIPFNILLCYQLLLYFALHCSIEIEMIHGIVTKREKEKIRTEIKMMQVTVTMIKILNKQKNLMMRKKSYHKI